MGGSRMRIGNETIVTSNGLPQGSSLSPISFDIFTEDMI